MNEPEITEDYRRVWSLLAELLDNTPPDNPVYLPLKIIVGYMGKIIIHEQGRQWMEAKRE